MKYGISKPAEETPGSLIAFLEKENFPTQGMYLFEDSAAYIHALKDQNFRENVLSHMIFNKQDSLLTRDTTKCQWAGAALFRSLHPDSAYKITKAPTLNQIFDKTVPFGVGERCGREKPEADFTVVITWAKFLGKYNYRLFDLDSAIKANRFSRINVIWLNIDMQKSWNLKPDQKVSFNRTMNW